MAPSTSSQPTTQGSPPQDTSSQPPKRSLRSRGSNAGMKENSSPADGGDADKDVGGSKPISEGSSMIVVGGLGGDARGGKFPPLCWRKRDPLNSRLFGTTDLKWQQLMLHH
jgi:hypothetical protein